ncbi:MAG: DUF4149 domain-containing protein [Haloarculaceae archaeon]
MSTLSLAETVVTNAALGAWLGAMAFFSFVAAPTVFDVLERDRAGTVVNAIFPTYYVVGVGAGTLALLAAVGRGALTGFDAPLLLVVVATVVAVLLAAYARWILIPKMGRAGEDGFARYHRRSVLLNGLALVAVAVALVASHL